MADVSLVALLKKSVEEWNLYRTRHSTTSFELSGADLSGAALVGANLSGLHLSGTNFSNANLNVATLIASDMSRANFSSAILISANLSRSRLNNASLNGAKFGGTVLGSVDLSEARGLGTAMHALPSMIGVDTVLRSGGNIPDEFLRGCGVDPLIQKMLIGGVESKTDAFYEWIKQGHNPLQRCFISYATEDTAFANRLQKALNERNVDHWYAPEHGRWGVALKPQVDLEISLRDRILLVCSGISLNKDWVKYEIEQGIEQEKKRGTPVIFPIMIDDALLAWKDPRGTHIREVLAADFRNATESPAFEKRLPRLLKALGYAT
jgi:hypothetical protein